MRALVILSLICFALIANATEKYSPRVKISHTTDKHGKRQIGVANSDLYFGQASKTGRNDVNNDGGWDIGYTVDGRFQPILRFMKGIAYRFNTTAVTADHPIYISTDLSGEGLEEYNGTYTNNSIANQFGAAAGTQLWWTPDKTTLELIAEEGVGLDFYYQCRFHSRMGYIIEVIPVSTCIDQQSRLGGSASELLDLPVSEALSDLLPLLGAYNGASAPNFDFRANATAFNALTAKYVSYISSNIMGCGDDGSVPVWTGRNLTTIHSRVLIGQFEWTTWFNRFMVYYSNRDDIGIPRQTKYEFAPHARFVCNQPSCKTSICDVWSNFARNTSGWEYRNSGENLQWLSAVVADFLNDVATNDTSAVLYPVFASRGVIANNATFLTRFAQYLGQKLGCSNTGFPAYSGRPLVNVHAGMNIARRQYTAHTTALLRAFDNQIMHPLDLDRVEQILRQDVAAVCTAADCLTNVRDVFTFRAKTKTSQHPFFNNGFPVGYSVDGVEGRQLNLVAGSTYVFHNEADCTHPLFISRSEIGAVNGAPVEVVTDGIVTPGTERVCQGEEFTWTPTQAQIGQTYYYQCTIHARMGYKVNVCDDVVGGQCIVNKTDDDAAAAAVAVSIALVALLAILSLLL